MNRKPWEIPIEYNEDRFVEEPVQDDTQPSSHDREHANEVPEPAGAEDDDVFGEDEDEDLPESAFESTDTEPMDYSRGPHDREFGVDEDAFESGDREPIDYGNGPHDDEFAIDDEDEYR